MPLTRRPRLVALDLDGTVVDENNEIPAGNLRAIRSLVDAGVHVAILTGRRMHTARQHLEALGLPLYAATNSGCILWDYPSEERLAVSYFPAELVVPLARLLAPHSLSYFIADSTDGAEFLYLEREPNPYYDTFRERFVTRIHPVQDVEELAGHNVTQLALPHRTEVVTELHARVQAEYGERLIALNVNWPLVPTMALEVFGPQGHKGGALADIAKRLGIVAADVVAVGDDVNDIAMLRWAGQGVAMGHAGPQVRSSADRTLAEPGAAALAPYLESLLALGESAG